MDILEVREFEEKVIQVNRVSKKTKGGNKIGFSVLVVVGDKHGQVGVGLGKATDVQSSIRKAVSYAKKHLIVVPMKEHTITHEILVKKGAARIFLKPASSGTGVIAGGAVRAVVEAAGIRDILSKVLGTSNKASNVYATIEALRSLKSLRVKPQAKVQEEPLKKLSEEVSKPVKVNKPKAPLEKKPTRRKVKDSSEAK